MRYIKCLMLFIALLCLLSACNKGKGDLKMEISLPDKKLTELASKTYSNTQLLSIVQFKGTIVELNKQYPIECIRKIGNTYRVSYLGHNSVAVIIFDSSENKVLGNVYSTFLTKADFSVLTIGQSLESVQRIDPDGEYPFLYVGRNDTPRVSTHYTKDGYLITVEYDENNTVLNIKTDLI